MTSVSALFYGRRTRLGRGTSDSDDLGFLSSDRFHDTNPSRRHRGNYRKTGCSTSASPRSDRRHLHHRSDHNRQTRHATPGEDESGRSSSYPREPCSQATNQDIALQCDCEIVTEAPIQNSFHGDTSDSIRVRFNSNERLPRSVLLARERLVQRLRGVSVSSVRESQETDPGNHFDSYWFSNSENLQNINVEENIFLTDSTLTAHRQLHESLSYPNLDHEVFRKAANNKQKFSGSDECSICLERYAEGNKLISLQCGHRFHSSCLSPWLLTCRKCPYCRSEISNR